MLTYVCISLTDSANESKKKLNNLPLNTENTGLCTKNFIIFN